MWILILTISVWNNGPSVAITSVEGFTTSAACQRAAATWLDAPPQELYVKRNAVCVSKS